MPETKYGPLAQTAPAEDVELPAHGREALVNTKCLNDLSLTSEGTHRPAGLEQKKVISPGCDVKGLKVDCRNNVRRNLAFSRYPYIFLHLTIAVTGQQDESSVVRLRK